MSFVGSQSIMIKDLSGNVAAVVSGGGLAIQSTTVSTRLVGNYLLCSSGSGGVALTAVTSSMPYGITVKNATHFGNSGVVLVGSETSPPYISGGFILAGGESVQLNVNQPDKIRVYGTLSGMYVTWFANY